MKGVDMFNFQDVMGDYYGYKPSDDAGKANKRTFQSNMIQSSFDTQLSMMQAEQAQRYDLDTRLQTANLELSNQKELMKDTFSYGTQKMGMEFDLQSKFATQMHGFDLERMGYAGEIQQDQTRLEGKENRLNLGEQGRQTRMNIGTQGVEDRAGIETQGGVDLKKIGASGTEQRASIGAQGDVDISKIGAGGEQDRKTIQAQGVIDVSKIGAQGEVDLSKIGATGTEQRKGIEAQGTADIGKIGAQGAVDIDKINVAGKQERETMGEKTRQTAKDRTNQYSFANQLAAR